MKINIDRLGRRGTTLVAALLITTLSAGKANALLVDDFDDGNRDGWALVPPFNGTLNVQATGGNPGGFMYSTDNAPGGFLITQFVDQTFDLASFNGIQWDEFVYTHANSFHNSSKVLLFGTDGTIFQHTPTPGPLATWNTRYVDFDESFWFHATLSAGTMSFADVLANGQVGFIVDASSAAQGGREVGIDNVTLVESPVPEPSSIVLATLGLAGVIVLRRLHPRKSAMSVL